MPEPEAISAAHWIIFAVAALIAGIALFHKAIKVLFKIAIIGVVAALVIYFLIQDGVIPLPPLGK